VSDSPFMRRIGRRDSGFAGRKAEASIASRLNGTLQPGSGALLGAKGDLKKDTPTISLLLENKTTTGSSLGIRQDWLHKIYQEALETSRTPALSMQFVRPNGQSEKRDRWVMIPEHFFQLLIGG